MIAQARCLVSDDVIEGVLRVGQVLREELPLLSPSLPARQDNAERVTLLVNRPYSDSFIHSLTFCVGLPKPYFSNRFDQDESPDMFRMSVSPSVLYSWDEVMRPGREDLLLHGVGDLVIVADPDGRPWAGVEPEDVAEPLLLRVQALDRRRAEAVHVTDQRQAWI